MTRQPGPQARTLAGVLGAHALLAAALWQLAPVVEQAPRAVRLLTVQLLGIAATGTETASTTPAPASPPARLDPMPRNPAAATPLPTPAALPATPEIGTTPPAISLAVLAPAPAPAGQPKAVAHERQMAAETTETSEAAPSSPNVPAAAARQPPFVQAQADRRLCAPAPHPAVLRERGIEGAVLLRVLVDREGRAAQVQLQAGSGWRLFDEAALQQARDCRYTPAQRDGQPVDSWVEFPVRFALG